METQTTNRCPRCGASPLRSWRELTDEERELARRLPLSADYSDEERAARHLFCTRCWHEETGTSSHLT